MARKVIIFITGFAMTVLGVALILRQWAAVVFLFRGVMGMILAVAGLVVLFSSTLKSHD
jgi:ABC-type protease/lipase transport system fused ATPase/permease subunit